MGNEERDAIDRRVLLVEDERRLREMLVRAIGQMEFVPTGAGSAEEGLAAFDERPFGIVIADLNLPGMHGMEFCRVVRERWPETQLLILTGFGDLDSAKAAIRLDVADFLTKPCTLADIESALDRALRRRRYRIIPRSVELPEEAEPTQRLDAVGGRPPCDGHETLHDIERRHILEALDRHGGNREATAEELGIAVRTLYYRLKSYQAEGFEIP